MNPREPNQTSKVLYNKHLEARGVFDNDDTDREPPISPELFTLQQHFFSLERARRYDQGIPQPFTYADVEAYMRVMKVELTAWQVGQLFTMDDYAVLANAKAATKAA